MNRFFFWEIFKTLQNSFFIVHPWIAASVLIQTLATLTINLDLRKCLKIVTIRKKLKFWRSYETIWKPYLEHDIT